MGKEKMKQQPQDKLKPLKDTITTLDHLQWYTPERMQQIQTHHLMRVIIHHVNTSPFFGKRIKDLNIKPQDVDAAHMKRLPILTRQDIISAGEDLFSTNVPESHGKPGESKSSGSTGEPVVIRATNLVGTFFQAYTVQEIAWNRRDPKHRLVIIKAGQFESKEYPNWAHPLISDTGPLYLINIRTDIKEQARIMSEFKPDMLSVYPSNLAALIDYWEETGSHPEFKHIKCVGETVTDKLRERVKKMFNIKIEDVYSSQELGTIAMPCDRGLYHTADQNLIVEVLDDKGNPVAEGETGRVVVTDMHNYATPLIRYDTGDWAVRGGKCGCGRGLKTLKRVMGRTRNLILRADGSRYWPMVGVYNFDELSFKIRRYQVIQTDRKTIEYKIVTDEPLTADQEAEMTALGKKALGEEFDIVITRFDKPWPLAPNGKHEEFICLVKG
jgi:phenylacetate-CoA ligase